MTNFALTLFPSIAAAISLIALLAVILRFRQMPGLVARIAALESEPRELPAAPVRPGVNLVKRTQALRQHRLGQSAETIAKSLEMTKAEVDLLLKLSKYGAS